jgi:hypothetical protein
MTKTIFALGARAVLAIISLMGMSEAQTHIFPAQDTNNVFTGANRFNAGVGVQYSGITISRPPNTSAPVLNQLVKETGSANPRQVTNLAVSDTNNILGLMVGTDSDTGDAVILDRGRGQCVFDDQTVVGDWVVASTTSAGACSDAGPTEPSLVQVLGRVVSVNTGAGTVAYMNLGTFDVVGNQQVNGGGSGTVAIGTTGAIAYYPQNGNQVGPDTSCTTDGSGHLVCKSFTASDANAAGFIGCTQGPVPTLSTANSVYFLCGTSITSSIGFTVPSAVGTTGQGLCKTGSTTDGSGHNIDTWGYCTFGASGATVSSVGLTVNGTSPSGIFTVTGSPVTTSGSLNFNLAGTSGGVPYFSSGTVLSSSSALTANLPVFGGGAGAAPVSGTRTGNTTQVATWTGATTATRCVDTDGSGNLQVGSADCVVNSSPSNVLRRGISFSIGSPDGSALSAASTTTRYVTVPFSCTISAYNLLVDAGTITVKFWKKATGTAIPTSSDSISTSGVSIASGTAIHSTTVSDFTTTTVTQNDIMAMTVTTVATAKYVNGVLECDQ